MSKKLHDLEQRLRRLETRRVLPLSSIDQGRLQSGNYTEDISGWALFPDLIEVGTLRVRDGIIGNDALTSPVSPAAGSDHAQGFALSTAAISTPASVALPVPAGFTQALVIGTSDLTVFSSASGGGAAVRTAINGNVSPYGQSIQLNAGVQGFVSNTFAQVLTGLGGGDVTIGGQVAAEAVDIPSDAGTWINVNAIAVFLR